MNVVCIGDVHLQSGQWRNQDRLDAFNQILSETAEIPVSAYVQLGDLWDGRVADDDLEVAADFVQRMADHAPTVLLVGNHARPGYSLLMRRIRARWPIHVVDTPQVLSMQTTAGSPLAIGCLPYPHKGGLVAANVAPGDIGREAAKALDVICMSIADDLRREPGQKLMIGHATISGAIVSAGQPTGIEGDIAVSAMMLARFGADVPLVFGHIHRPQDCQRASYAGSISATDWSETEFKRYLTVEYADGQSPRLVSHPLRTVRMFHLEGDLGRDTFTWEVRKGPDGPVDTPPETWENCDIRVRARYPAAERDVLGTAKARIAARFPGVRRLDVEMVAVQVREVRAPEVVAAQTLPEKLRAWARLSGVTWGAEIERCSEALLATEDGDALTQQVQARLEPLADLSLVDAEVAL